MNKARPERHRLQLTGIVQGVGFRPFVFRLAQRFTLSGWVANDRAGVCVEVQGPAHLLLQFQKFLSHTLPPHAEIHSLTCEAIPVQNARGFVIRESDAGSAQSALILPDLAPCKSCVQELFEPGNRRYRYPFINCTQCGPRFSIVERLPYDRAHTAMQAFPLCADCMAEYKDPDNRRFHAEPTACPSCGPQLRFCAADGKRLAAGEAALRRAVEDIRGGKIIAIKNIGGFQLMARADSDAAIALLRQRKQRPHKPFALLYPDLASVHRDCFVSAQEERLLLAAERPIVILRSRGAVQGKIAPQVSPDNPNLGVMLPSSPLHHLLMHELQQPLVATSGNLAGEPICIDDADALQRLGQIADGFLLHNRRILRPLDDSVARVMDGQPVLLRRARGYVPRPLVLPDSPSNATTLLAVGADLKNSVATTRGNTVLSSQHIGDLEDRITMGHFTQTITELAELYLGNGNTRPWGQIICDQHPGFFSTRWSENHANNRDRSELLRVPHHVAHFFSCLAEHGHGGAALGICWDGTGYGDDGVLRGSEFLHWDGAAQVRRVASLREFPLPGGEQAMRQPRLALAGLLFACFGSSALWPVSASGARLAATFSSGSLFNLERILVRKLNTPVCSSIGRLFDAVSALFGLVQRSTFEGQGAMAVENAAQDCHHQMEYPFVLRQALGHLTLDWEPLLSALLKDVREGRPVPWMATAFHNTLAQMAVSVATALGEKCVFLSGGAFQNKRLLETTTGLLRAAGFDVHCHRNIPPNDGGIAVGQIYYARCMQQVAKHRPAHSEHAGQET
ncbi:carbamoyltransferase HypF [Microbulbifer sp. Q7]|uniref:carbamoyltransferase HypF n=1 Tax=Microbulbifer sp. Q7 TaxID=1785091 RepID=UPI0008379097|nr:carbamoyltransferase HypF [Microbulbifer sp. Q7]